MLKTIILSIFAILILGIIFLASDMKNAYKILPVKSNPTLEISPLADWREFKAPSDEFSVKLPAPPQYAKDAAEIPNTDAKRRYEMYVSEKMDGSIFMINLITYPPEIKIDADELMRENIDEIMQNKPGNKLKSLQDTIYVGHKAIDFEIENPKLLVKGKAFIIDHTVYLLLYVASHENFTIGEYDHFIQSFQLPVDRHVDAILKDKKEK